MPTYEYQCKTCGHQFEQIQRFSDAPLTACPKCGGAIHRVLFPAGIIFKGSGWYITDSRKGASSEKSTSPASSTTDKAPSTEKAPEGGAGKAEKAAPDKAAAATKD
ncbi:MAG TPA: FmdB family zinc ribbon protein [Thermomicrobiales bacterium]|nr:FmdB family zinc ribbon protein [Thermomicrobiales bacterium]